MRSGLFAVQGSGQASRSSSWLETTATDFVTSLLAVSDVESYDENPAGGLKFEHYNAATQLELPMLRESPFRFFADFGVGATRMRSNEPGQLTGRDSFVYGTYFSGVGGVTVRYQLTSAVGAYVGARYFTYVTNAEDAAIGQTPSPGRLMESSSWTFPFTLGFRIRFK
jgi:hypothetical protein